MKTLTIVYLCLNLTVVMLYAGQPPQDNMTDWGGVYEDFPHLIKELSENMDNPDKADYCANIIWHQFMEIDACNYASPGHPEVLKLIREALKKNLKVFMIPAFEYLAWKGDESDIALLEKAQELWGGYDIYISSSLAVLSHLRRRQTENFYAGGEDGRTFVSFANTGPQAVYFWEILKKMLEVSGSGLYWGGDLGDPIKTMVVSFDEDDNPVCNVDLAKLGISMPVITPKPHPGIPYYQWNEEHPEYTVVFPHETTNAPSTDATLNSPPAEGCPKGGVVPDDEATQPPDETTQDATQKQPIPRLYIGISALLCLCVIAYLVWKTNQKKSV